MNVFSGTMRRKGTKASQMARGRSFGERIARLRATTGMSAHQPFKKKGKGLQHFKGQGKRRPNYTVLFKKNSFQDRPRPGSKKGNISTAKVRGMLVRQV